MSESLVCRCSRGTLYDVLQVSPWCEPDVIQAAYRALARTRHPDVNRDPDAEDQMRRLNVAYQVLSDPVRRVRYDEELVLEASRPAPGRTVTRVADPPRPAPAADDTLDDTWEPAMTAGTGPGSRSRRASATRSRPVAFPTAGFDLRGEASGLPRSAIYVSVVLVTAIAVLVVWLLVDALVDRSTPTYRGVRVSDERNVGTSPRSLWTNETSAPGQDPGLSRSLERWNR